MHYPLVSRLNKRKSSKSKKNNEMLNEKQNKTLLYFLESPYRYSELPREGLGPPTAHTGMFWSTFRPPTIDKSIPTTCPTVRSC